MNYPIEQAYWSAVKTDLHVFLQQVFGTVYPGEQLVDNWHIEAMVGALERAIKGDGPRRTFSVPPRSLKSFSISVALTAFLLGNDPTAKIICVSYSEDLAKTLARDFKRIVESPWYQGVFPEMRRKKDTEREFVTDQGGYRLATSVNGTLTGIGADVIIIDDPLKPEDARSDASREAVNRWYGTTLISRLNDKQRGLVIIVAQRLHVNDLIGYVHAGGGFKKLAIPAIAIEREVIPLRHGTVHVRQPGEVIQPELEGLQVLENLKRECGAFNFAAQYQQRPEIPEGAMFLSKWLKVIKPVKVQGPGQWHLSLDTALSTADTADYTALTLTRQVGRTFNVFHAERGRWTYEEQKALVERYVRQFGSADHPLAVLIEYANTGISLYTHFRDCRDDRLRAFCYKPKTSKLGRAGQAVPIVEAGRVHLVRRPGADGWIEPFLTEVTSFPYGRFDDWVDSLCQMLVWAQDRKPMGPSSMLI